MKIPAILLLLSALVPAAYGQDKKPADPKTKPATHSPELSALNNAKQDTRNKETLKKAKAALDRAMQKDDAARKELERLDKTKTVPTTDEARAKLDRLEKLRKSLDPKDREELERLMKESKEAVQDEIKKAAEAMRERNRRENPPAPAPVPAPEKDNTPGSFDNAAPTEPLAVRKEPVFVPAPLYARQAVPGITKDPKDPSKELPSSDPRTRTYVFTGEARLRLADKAVDADEVYIVFKEGRAPGGATVKGKEKEKKAPAPAADPVKGKAKESDIERIIARGRVRFMFVDKDGHVQAGRCGLLTYEDAKGLFILKDWPSIEVGGRLIKGPEKDSVIRLGQKNQEDSNWERCEIFELDRELSLTDLPKDRRSDIPPTRPARSGPASNSSSEIR